jgi:curved DNA-binding protein CbpA
LIINDPYQVLGLPREATAVEIKRAYFALVKQHPPESDAEGFQRVRAAYDALRTPELRAETDRQLIQPPPPFVPPRRLPEYDLSFYPQDHLQAARRESDLEQLDFSAEFRPIPDLSEVSI